MKILVLFAVLAVCASASAKMSHSQAMAKIQPAGITTKSSGNCSDRSKPTCTSLEQVNDSTINNVLTLKSASGCPIVITGGTEVGHASGTYSHYNGYKLDYSLNSCLEKYITSHFSYMGLRPDGYKQWKSASGNIYCWEGNHWDVTYY